MNLSVSTIVKSFFLLSFIFFSLSCFAASIESHSQAQESDRVINLPGQSSNPPISQFSGYITVNRDHGRALFYWFFEAQSQPSNKPLLLWLNGGPGCSSIGYGAAVELGPLKVKKHGVGLEFNKYAWNKDANLLFLESPVGVGFSYTNTSSDFNKLDDGFVAEDAYSFLVNWLKRFPQFKAHDFFISGESYAGHYGPQLAELVYDRNKDETNYPFINLKGFIVGNPVTNEYYDYKGILEFAWSHAVISDQEYEKTKQICDFKLFNWTDPCARAMNAIFDQYNEIDIYNIYTTACRLNTSGSKVESNGWFKRRMRIPAGGYDPCFSTYTAEYFNKIDVQTSLHAIKGKWEVCSDLVGRVYNFTVFSILPIYTKLIKAGLKIWIYSGDMDGRVPVIGSRYCIEALGLPLKAPWRTWYHNNQVGGRIIEYEGLTYVTVRGAGHLVPLNKPSESLALLHSFLFNDQLPPRQ